MGRGALLAGLLFSFSAGLVRANELGVRTIDRMTCRTAIKFVRKFRRYYVDTFDGPIPIYPILPVDQNPTCNPREILRYEIRPTLDTAECHLGFSCRAN